MEKEELETKLERIRSRAQSIQTVATTKNALDLRDAVAIGQEAEAIATEAEGLRKLVNGTENP